VAVQSTSPDATPVTQNYWFMHLQNTGPDEPTLKTHNPDYKNTYSLIITWLQMQHHPSIR